MILTDEEKEKMMEMMLTMKDTKNIKLIVCSQAQSHLHLAKSDSSYVFKRAGGRESLFEIIKEIASSRKQYFHPI